MNRKVTIRERIERLERDERRRANKVVRFDPGAKARREATRLAHEAGFRAGRFGCTEDITQFPGNERAFNTGFADGKSFRKTQ